ncbi:MAG: hypothetical protein O8C55_00360, partial [Candidatus Methanoperedens sp.]|nr:hypothetical protein [Candidatus Methanoperedens sp.]
INGTKKLKNPCVSVKSVFLTCLPTPALESGAGTSLPDTASIQQAFRAVRRSSLAPELNNYTSI